MLFVYTFFIAQFIISENTAENLNNRGAPQHAKIGSRALDLPPPMNRRNPLDACFLASFILAFSIHIYYRRTLLHFLNVIYREIIFSVSLPSSARGERDLNVYQERNEAFRLKRAYEIRLLPVRGT